MKIAVTGHRPGKLGNEWDGIGDYSDRVRKHLQSVISEMDEKREDPLMLISGMALGVDMIWAELAIKNHLRFIAAIPCIGQEFRWTDKQIARYEKILADPHCEHYLVSPSMYNEKVMQVRNEWMVDNADLVVAIWDGTPGGTGNCVEYAKSKNKKLMIFMP